MCKVSRKIDIKDIRNNTHNKLMKFCPKNDKLLLAFLSVYGRFPNFKEVLFFKRFHHNNSMRSVFNKMVSQYEFIEDFKLNLSENELDLYFNELESVSSIPKNIYMTLASFDDLSEDCTINHIKNQWQALIHCTIHRYNNEECRSLIEENFEEKILNAYDKLIPGAFKSDIWRLCALYLYGGIYSDVHIIPDEKSNPNIVLDSADYVFCIDYPVSSKYIYNAMMKMPKNSPVALKILDTIVDNVQKEKYPSCDLDVTGPGVHGKVIMDLLQVEEFKEGFHNFRIEDDNYSVLFLKHQKHYNRRHDFEYNISLHKNILFLCRYKNYREELNQICKLEHYSSLFKKKKIYNT